MSLVSKNYEIERAIVQLKNEICQVKQEQGEAKNKTKSLARLLKNLLSKREEKLSSHKHQPSKFSLNHE